MRSAWMLMALAGIANAAPSDTCKKEVAALGDYITQVGAESRFMLPHADQVKLVERGGLPAAPHETVVEMSPTSLIIEFTERVEKGKVAKAFAIERQKQDDPGWARTSPGLSGHPHEMTWLIDEATPWGDIVAALDAAQLHGFDHAQLVFSTKAMASPPRTAIDDAVDHDKRNISYPLEPYGKAFVAKCPGLLKPLNHIARSEDWIEKEFSPDFRAGLEACDCAVPMAQVRSFLYYMFVPRPKTGAVAVVLAHTGTVISAAKKATWKDVAPKITGGTIKVLAK